MDTIDTVQFEDYADWYLSREHRKDGRTPSAFPRSDLRDVMAKTQGGKLWPGWESFSWQIVRITTLELRSVLILANDWTREEGLVRTDQLRIMANALKNAISSGYFRDAKPAREKHQQWYAEYQVAPPTGVLQAQVWLTSPGAGAPMLGQTGTVQITTTPVGWYFTPVAGQHFFTPESRISFNFTDRGPGSILVSIGIIANFSSAAQQALGNLAGAGELEDKTWAHLINSIREFCLK